MAKKEPTGPSPVRVFTAATTVEAAVVIGFLEEKGVQARQENPLTAAALGGVDRVLEGKRGVGVVVSSADEERAMAALKEFRARPALGDGERVEEE